MSALIAHAVSSVQMQFPKFPDLAPLLPQLYRVAFGLGTASSFVVWAFYTLS